MNFSVPQQFRQLRARVPFDCVSIGYAGISLVPLGGLQSAQEGYGAITGDADTGWRPEWLVVGSEDRCGDPIFIDTEDAEFPVYTAAHGMGEWTPKLVAFSFRHFVQVLEQLQVLARRRENPVRLQRNPVTEQDSHQFIEFIRRGSPDVDFGFWRDLYETET